MGEFSPQDFNAAVQTIAGEGANQPPEAQRAIASTILNRHAIQGGSIADIASDPKVYNGAKSKNAMQAVPGSALYSTIAENIAPVFTEGPTTKATHFVNPTLQADLGRKQPAWAQGDGEKIGDHVFYDRSADLEGAKGPPSPDELEQHFSAQPAVAPIAQSRLPNVPGYIDNPQNGPGETGAIPIGGPSADELERHFGGGPVAKPLSQSDRAAAADAASYEAQLNSFVPNPAVAVPAFQGLTQGYGDEIKGKLFGAGTGLKNAILDAMGKPIPYSMAQADAAEVQAARHALSGISQAHPIVSTASEVTGGVLPWLAGGEMLGGAKAVAEAPSVLGRAAQLAGRMGKGVVKGVGSGGLGGAVSGFGNAEGDASERAGGALQGAETGAVLGGALGGAAPLVAPAVGKVAGALGGELKAAAGAVRQGAANALDGVGGKPVETTAADYFAAKSPAAQKLKGMTTPPDMAENVEPTPAETRMAQTRVAQMLAAKGMHTDDLRAIPEDIPHTTAEAIGSQTVNHLASLARRSGVTPDAAGTQIAQRAQNFGSAILDDFGAATGVHPEEAAGNIDALVGRLKGEANPLFAAVRSQPGPVWSPELAHIAQRPVVAKAIDAAANDLRNAGKDPLVAGFKLNPDSGLYELNGNTLEKTAEGQPSAETWENVRQRIGDQVDRDPFGRIIPDSQSRGNFNINAAKRDLTNVLAGDAKGDGALIPGYRNALDASGEYLSAKGAFDRGAQSLLTDKVTPRAFEKAYGDLSQAEQAAWKAGVANKLYDQSQTRTGLTPSMLKAPAFQAKIRTIMGDQADGFLDRLTQRVRLQATGNRIMPGAGSQTTPLLQAGGETGPATDALGNVLKEAMHAKASPLTFLAKHAVNATLSDKAANIAETPGYRNAYGRLLLQHPRATADELRAAGREAARMLPRARLPVGAAAGYVGGQTGRPSQ